MQISAVFNPFVPKPNPNSPYRPIYPTSLQGRRSPQVDSVQFSGDRLVVSEGRANGQRQDRKKNNEVAEGVVLLTSGVSFGTAGAGAAIVGGVLALSNPVGWGILGAGALAMLAGAGLTNVGASKVTGTRDDSNGVITGTV